MEQERVRKSLAHPVRGHRRDADSTVGPTQRALLQSRYAFYLNRNSATCERMTALEHYARVDQLLLAWRGGAPGAVDGLFALVYDDLRQIARRQLARLRTGDTLAPTVLVHEVYIRWAARSSQDVVNRHHFLALAARAMRHVIVDHVRRRQARKRDGGVALPLDSAVGDQITMAAGLVDVITIDEALSQLETLDERQARIVEMRFFAGLDLQEIAVALDVSERTVKRDWHKARAFLYHALY
jgi:RNA polymerase sigma factor (TIGR02999 family)